MSPFLTRFSELVHTRYPILKHALYSVVWMLAVTGAFALPTPGATWSLDLTSLTTMTTLFFLFFYMRVVDEIRDLEYDKVHNPHRIMAEGRFSIQEAAGVLTVCSGMIVAMNISYSLWAVLVLCLIMGHALWMIRLEESVALLERSLFANTAVGIALKVMATVYVGLMFATQNGSPAVASGWIAAASLVCGYLHWEVARKVVRPEFAIEGEKLYSREAGVQGAFTVSFVLLGLAVAGTWATCGRQFEGWVQGLWLLPLLPSTLGLIRFSRAKEYRYDMGLMGLISYVVLLFLMAGTSLAS